MNSSTEFFKLNYFYWALSQITHSNMKTERMGRCCFHVCLYTNWRGTPVSGTGSLPSLLSYGLLGGESTPVPGFFESLLSQVLSGGTPVPGSRVYPSHWQGTPILGYPQNWDTPSGQDRTVVPPAWTGLSTATMQNRRVTTSYSVGSKPLAFLFLCETETMNSVICKDIRKFWFRFYIGGCKKFFFQSQINNQNIYLKKILHKYILYKGHQSYNFIFPMYLGMALISTDFLLAIWQGSLPVGKSWNIRANPRYTKKLQT